MTGGEDPAAYLAGRVRSEHSLDGPASLAALRRVCRQRGCPVLRAGAIPRAGYYVVTQDDGSMIVLSRRAQARVLAHELFHHLIHDNAQHGVLYTRPEFLEDDVERAADRFAALLV